MVLVLTLVGCSTSTVPTPRTDAAAAPTGGAPSSSSPSASAAPSISLAEDVVLLRAWSGPWGNDAERTGSVHADVVLYRDGLVVADISLLADVRELRAIRLSGDELEEVVARIAEATPQPVDHASFLSHNSGCFDCSVQVIRVATPAGAVELAVYALLTDFGFIPNDVPSDALELSRILDELDGLAAERPAVETDARLPLVPAAPFQSG